MNYEDEEDFVVNPLSFVFMFAAENSFVWCEKLPYGTFPEKEPLGTDHPILLLHLDHLSSFTSPIANHHLLLLLVDNLVTCRVQQLLSSAPLNFSSNLVSFRTLLLHSYCIWKEREKNMSNSSQAIAISLKGSTDIVTEFFNFSINTILYQRGIYPPESFKKVQKYGLSMMVTTDDGLTGYMDNILRQLDGEDSALNYRVYMFAAATVRSMRNV